MFLPVVISLNIYIYIYIYKCIICPLQVSFIIISTEKAKISNVPLKYVDL